MVDDKRTRALPVVGNTPGERADAARNRRKITAAAQELTTSRSLEDITWIEIAEAAGVGVGTVYRRFPDRAALAYALLDGSERELQDGFLHGPPPLGPGAPPGDRIRAFLHAYLDRLLRQMDLLLAAETASPGGRYSAAYVVHRHHLLALLDELRPAGSNAYLADALLAALAAPLVAHHLQDPEIGEDGVRTGLDELAGRVIACG